MDVVFGGRHIGDTNGRRRGYGRLHLHDANSTAMSRRLVEHGFLVPLSNDEQVVEVVLRCVVLKEDNGLVEGIQLRLGGGIGDPLPAGTSNVTATADGATERGSQDFAVPPE